MQRQAAATLAAAAAAAAVEKDLLLTVTHFLHGNHPDEWQQLQNGRPNSSSIPFEAWLLGNKYPACDGSSNSDVSNDPCSDVGPSSGIWLLTDQQKQVMWQGWIKELLGTSSGLLVEQLHQVEKASLELRAVKDGALERALEGKRVIGCTTTGAAKYKKLFKNLKVSL